MRHVAHLLGVHPRGDATHEVGIGRASALLLLEERQLQSQIVRVLAGQQRIVRIARRLAGAVTVGTGGNVLIGNASLGDGLATLDGLRRVLRRG